MNLDFDYKDFQKESSEALAKIFTESAIEEDVDQNEFDRTYDMIQKILSCKKMIKCHPFLYSLDQEHVCGDDRIKVEKLYECGVKKGLIKGEKQEVDTEGQNIQNECGCDGCDCNAVDPFIDKLCGGPEDQLTNQSLRAVANTETKPTFTILYSASKDGQTKTGEFYSNAFTKEEAKNECITSMNSAGYTSVKITAVELSDGACSPIVTYEEPGVNLYDVFNEDDSVEYEKQETGDNSSGDTADTSIKSEDPEQGANSDNDNEPSVDVGSNEKSSSSENTEAGNDSKKDDSQENNGDGDKDDEEEKTDTDNSSEDQNDNEKEDDTTTDNDTKEEKAEEKKLTSDEKNTLKEEYTKIFKDVLKKMNVGKSFDEMTLEERIDFLKKITEKWSKNDPSEFLKDKDQEKLNKIVIKNEDNEEK